MSEFHLNNPDFQNAIPIKRKFKSAQQAEEHEKIVSAGLKMMGVGEDKRSEMDRVIDESTARITMVRNWAHTLDQEVRAAGQDHNRAMLFEELTKNYWKAFEDMDKDRLLATLSILLTRMTIKEIV